MTSEEWYAIGNECRKKQDFQGAINAYTKSIELDPESPAVHARTMLQEIMAFYNKEMYNP